MAALVVVSTAIAAGEDPPTVTVQQQYANARPTTNPDPTTPAGPTLPAELPPPPPTGLTATPGDGKADLCWNPVPGALAYIVNYRDVAKAEDWQRMPYPLTDRCWQAGQLWNNHTYQFRLAASNLIGEGGFSEVIDVTPKASAPQAPRGLVATPGDGQVRLCWQAAANADMYVMYLRDTTVGQPWTRVEYPVTEGLCWTAHYLLNNHELQFRITSANSNGESGFSKVVKATPARPTLLPAVPTGLTAKAASGRVLLCWRPAAHANAYVAHYRDVSIGQDWVTMPYPIQNGTCWNADQLTNGHTYQFRLNASNNDGNSGLSEVVQAVPR